ncbi:MAG: translation initiation factor IF-2 N-terminal domain-containing protein, partial [Lentisphaeria bacterium]|nr:translation initiation factor IF-2 N-terminal domain-containing protein [Lentisphaeria bacterium]
MKKLKVKDLAETYKVSVEEVIAELTRQGITVKAASSQIPEDMVELVEAFFDDLYVGDDAPAVKDDRPRNKQKSRGKEEFERSGKNNKPGKNKDNSHADSAPAAGGAVVDGVARLSAPFIVKNVAEAIGKKPNEVIGELMKLGELLSINQPISENTLRKLLKNFSLELEIVQVEKKAVVEAENDYEMPAPADPAELPERPPVVTFMGHVDHGKTSLQDRVRNTHVVDGESGRITQHIGASTVVFNGKPITFIDTPGHAAFTSMRARGANVTDIVVLVVAADDGFMPQTIEAMNHALAAKVPLIVAINKIDLPDANPDRIYLHMQQNNLTCEDWGGTVGVVKVSAKTGEGIDDLLERILLEAEMLDLKANPKRPAVGTVLEAQVENGLGPTASILVQNGTLSVGDM